MNVKPILFSSEMVRALLEGRKTQTRRVVKYRNYAEQDAPIYPHECPYGKPGDLLWVRETWGDPWHHAQPRAFYRATDEKEVGWHPDFDGWKPSIHMPRWASRLTLRITDVRVQRLQDVTRADCVVEGCTERNTDGAWYGPEVSFAHLWDRINARRGYGWNENPWVWCLSFEVIQQNVDSYIYTKAVA